MSNTTQKVPAASDVWTKPRGMSLLLAGLILAMFMASLSQMILATALPTIVGELGDISAMPWVLTAYILASTIMMPVHGQLSDRFGRKPLLLTAIALFVVGSIVGGLAPSVEALVVARGVQGLGGGGLLVLSQATVADLVPARNRGKYLGLLSAGFAIASVVGPLLGGWFAEGPGWRWSFWINIPVGVLAAAACLLFLRLPRRFIDRTERIDIAGMALLAAITSAFVFLVAWGGTHFAWLSWQSAVLIAVATLGACLFLLVERRTTQAVIPLHLFTRRDFTVTTIAGLLTGAAIFGFVGYLPSYIQLVAGATATDAGLLMLPLMGGVIIASIASGNVVAWTGRYKLLLVTASAAVAVGLAITSLTALDTPLWVLCILLAVVGAGWGAGMQLTPLIVQNSVSARLAGTATAANNYFRQVGAAIGTAVMGTLFTARLAAHFGSRPTPAFLERLTPEIAANLPGALQDLVREAYHDAFLPLLLWLSPLALCAATVLCSLTRTPLTRHLETDQIEAEGTAAIPVVRRGGDPKAKV